MPKTSGMLVNAAGVFWIRRGALGVVRAIPGLLLARRGDATIGSAAPLHRTSTALLILVLQELPQRRCQTAYTTPTSGSRRAPSFNIYGQLRLLVVVMELGGRP